MADDIVADDRIESLTIRHLRDLRRTQDLMLDLLKRQTELSGRLARDVGELKLELERGLNEVRGDVLLMENRSITAAENDEFFRRKFGSIEDKLDQLSVKLGEIAKT
jgi:hypothetical protein